MVLFTNLVQGFSDSWQVGIDRSAAYHHGHRGSFVNLFSRSPGFKSGLYVGVDAIFATKCKAMPKSDAPLPRGLVA
jgi:hypothetical protein